jgi:hypothetical protein
MNDKTRAAMQQALEVLKEIHPGNMTLMAEEAWNKATTAIREALAQQKLSDSIRPKGKSITKVWVDEINQTLEQPEQEQDRQIDQLIQERDHRDEIIDKLCDAVLGPDRYEWSSQYFFEDAVREVEERMAALEQPAQQEPVGYFSVNNYGRWEENEGTYGQPLYDHPQAREPLTDEEIAKAWSQSKGDVFMRLKPFARAIEAAHGIKEFLK